MVSFTTRLVYGATGFQVISAYIFALGTVSIEKSQTDKNRMYYFWHTYMKKNVRDKSLGIIKRFVTIASKAFIEWSETEMPPIGSDCTI